MLKRQNRINRKLFQSILKKSKIYSDDFFTVRFLQDGGSFPRAAVSVSKKVSTLAVARNLMRRRVIAILERHLANIKKNSSILLFPKKTTADLSFEALEREILHLLKKIGLLL